MIVYKKDGKEFYSLRELRRAYPYTLFPKNPSDEILALMGVTKEERPDSEAMVLARAKLKRSQDVANIKVEVDGMTFDGDEMSQSRMARAITAAETAGLDQTVWVLADNTVATVTKAQLQQALSKSMLAMAELWTKPYEGESDV